MSYIDALYKKDEDKIYVVERDPKKGRVFVEYDARYVFYYPDARGKHRSITGEPLQKVQCSTSKEFIKEQRIRSNKQLYEQDINPVFRCLEENYLGKETPKLNVMFFDIEVDTEIPQEDLCQAIDKLEINNQFLDEELICPDQRTDRFDIYATRVGPEDLEDCDD